MVFGPPPSTFKDCDSVSPPLNFQQAQMSHLLHTLHPVSPPAPWLPTRMGHKNLQVNESEQNFTCFVGGGGFSISAPTEAPCSPFCLLTSPS